MATQIVYPDADLAGDWELTEPLPVDGGGYTEPTLVGVDTAGYAGEDSAADAAQTGALTLPTVLADDVGFVVTAVSDETTTAELAVVPTIQGTNEVQTIASWLKSGTFTITYDGQTTSALNWDDDAATIETALEALSNIAVGEATVAGGPLDGEGASVTVTFSGTLANTDVALMTVSVAYVAPVDEVQTLDSDRTGGTFTLEHDTNITSAIAWNATASTIQTALEGLAHLDAGDVVCTGGPINSDDVVITFGGAKAGSDEAAIIVDDTSATGGTGMNITETTKGVAETGLTVTETTPGVAERSFVLETSFNIPRGASYEPQIHVWSLALTAADSGKDIDFSVADHGTLHTWAAGLMVWRNLDTTVKAEDFGTETNGDATFGDFGSVTPTTAGSKVVAVLSKALAGTYFDGGTDSPSTPSGYVSALEATSDAMVLDLWYSGPLSAVAEEPENVSWNEAVDYATGLMTLKPDTASAGGSDLYAVVDSVDTDTWIELSSAAGSMYEVLEFDLSSIPSGAVLTGAKFEFAHSSGVRNKLRAVIVGINADDTIVVGSEQQIGYLPVPVNQVQTAESAYWYELEDGSLISDYSRLGIALISSDRHPALSSHRVYWVRAEIDYEPGGPEVSAVSGPSTAGDPITWTYSSDSGLSQTHYQVMVIEGSAQDPDLATVADDQLTPATGEIVYDSGQVAGQLVRSVTLSDAPLGRGTQTVAVRAWARLESGAYVASDWDTADFDITGTPTAPGAQATDPVFDETSGGVDVDVAVPAGVSRAWLQRSNDSGSTWELVEDSPFTVTPSTTETLTDYRAPVQSTTLRYQVTFDTGPMAETAAPVAVGSGDISTPAGQWYLICPDDPTLNVQLSVKDVSYQRPVRTVTVEQPGNAVTASSLPLAQRISMSVWVKENSEYLAILAALESGLKLRLVDIWGREIDVRVAGGVDDAPQRWKALPAESTGLRDAHVFGFQLIEEGVSE